MLEDKNTLGICPQRDIFNLKIRYIIISPILFYRTCFSQYDITSLEKINFIAECEMPNCNLSLLLFDIQ